MKNRVRKSKHSLRPATFMSTFTNMFSMGGVIAGDVFYISGSNQKYKVDIVISDSQFSYQPV